MSLLLPILLAASLAGLRFRRREGGLAWCVAGLAATAALAPALLVPHGVPTSAAVLRQLAPWQGELAAAPITTAGNPDLGDVTFQIQPWLLFLRDEARAGRLPFWNPYQYAGAPFWSNGQGAPLFPLHWLFVLLPVELGLVLLPWLRVVIGSLGAFYLARQLAIGRDGALLAAVVYPLSGRLLSFLLFPMANALCLVPWVFLAVEKLAAEPPTGRHWRWLAVLGALQLVAGHPETALFTAVASGLYLLIRRAGQPFAAWMSLASAWVVAGLLAGLALVPLAYMVLATNRWQEWDPGSATPLATIGSLLLRFVLPDAFGHPARGDFWGPLPFVPTSVYAGALTLPLAAVGLVSRADRRLRALAGMAAICLLAAYHFPGLRELLLVLPVLQKTLHHYLLLAVELALALLAGAGLERWRAGEARGLVPGLAVVAGALGAGWVAFHADWSARGDLPRQLAWSLLVLGLPLLLHFGASLTAERRRLLAPCAIAIALTDLAYANARSNPGLPAGEVYPETPALRFLAGRPERLAAVGYALRPNAATAYGLRDVRGDDSLKLRAYEDFFRAHLGPGHPTFFQPIERWDAAALDALGVRWVIAYPDAPPPDPAWKAAYRGPDATIYERPAALPLVRFADPATDGSFEVMRQEPGRWEIDWRCATPCELVVAETHAAGWRAWNRGFRVPIETRDEILMGIRVGPRSEGPGPEGPGPSDPSAGRLVLRYRPPGIGWGLAATMLGWLLLGALGAEPRRGTWRNRPPRERKRVRAPMPAGEEPIP